MLCPEHQGVRLYFSEDLAGDRFVDVEDHNRIAASTFSSKGHIGDVDVLFGKQRAHPSDDTRLILVAADEEMAFELGFHFETVDADESWVAFPEYGGRDRGGFRG